MTQVRPGQIFRWPTPNMWTAENRWNTVSSQGFSLVFIPEGRRSPVHSFQSGFAFFWRITWRPSERSRRPPAAANALQALLRRRLPFWWQGDIIATSELAMRGFHFATIQIKIETGKKKQYPWSTRVHMLQFLSTCNAKIVIYLAHVHL